MSGILVSLLNVGIVILSVWLAVHVGTRKRPVVLAALLVAVGVATYGYEIYDAISNGNCSPENTVVDFLIGVSGCLGIGGSTLVYAQVAILAGMMVLLFRPLVLFVMREAV